MDAVGAFEAKTHLARLLDRVAQGESITITRHGTPVAQLVPVENADRDRAKRAVARILARRKLLKGASLDELLSSTHEGHRY